MEITTTTIEEKEQKPARRAAINALALVGFIGLLFIGIVLAIYAARYVPELASRFGAAAVSLTRSFSSGDDAEPSLMVVSSSTESVSFGSATSTMSSTTEILVLSSLGSTPAPASPTGVRAGTPRASTAVEIPLVPYGDTDLTVTVTEVGYCTSENTRSFREAREIPDDENGGARFVIKNIGTNVSGRYDFSYELPTNPTVKKEKNNEPSLNPGSLVEYTVCFTEQRSGENRTVKVTVDQDDEIDESNERNNSDTKTIDIER